MSIDGYAVASDSGGVWRLNSFLRSMPPLATGVEGVFGDEVSCGEGVRGKKCSCASGLLAKGRMQVTLSDGWGGV